MANQKPKKTAKKSSSKPEAAKDAKTPKEMKENKEVKEVKAAAEAVAPATIASTCEKPMKGFFARKYDAGENILTIFKTPKIWGALIGEALGTMLLVMLFLTLGINNLLYVMLGVIGIYVVIVGLSGANLNPLITVGMMATRRMSAIRGILYMLAQLLGGWIGLIIINAFRLGSGTTQDLPTMAAIDGEMFWAIALVELVGAIIIAFVFARSMRYARKQPLTFALAVASGLVLAMIIGVVVSQGFFAMSDTMMMNPVAALMYQILPTAADDLGALMQSVGLALAAYVVMPIIGGVIGFYVSDVATRLSCGGYFCACDAPCCGAEKHCEKK